MKRIDQILILGGGSAGFLASLANNVPTATHAGHYAFIVRDKAMQRQLLDVGAAITERGAPMPTRPDTLMREYGAAGVVEGETISAGSGR